MENIKTRYQQAGEEIKALEVTVTRANGEIAELENERSALRAQWLELLDEAKQAEDMSDPKNWRVGDLMEIVKPKYTFDVKRGLVEITSKNEDGILDCKPLTSHPHVNGRTDWTYTYGEVSFHSRPTK